MQEVVEKSKQRSAPLRLRLSLLSTGQTNVLRVGTVVRAVETLWAMEGRTLCLVPVREGTELLLEAPVDEWGDGGW